MHILNKTYSIRKWIFREMEDCVSNVFLNYPINFSLMQFGRTIYSIVHRGLE